MAQEFIGWVFHAVPVGDIRWGFPCGSHRPAMFLLGLLWTSMCVLFDANPAWDVPASQKLLPAIPSSRMETPRELRSMGTTVGPEAAMSSSTLPSEKPTIGTSEQSNAGIEQILPELAMMQSINENTCSTEDLDGVTLLDGPHLPQKLNGKFGTCALVGGSSSLLSRRDGELIDSHDAVIRINRLPSRAYVPYIGRKTTIYFAGAVADKVDRFVEGAYLAQYVNSTGSSVECSYVNSTCAFDNLVLNAGKLQFNQSWERKYPLWKPRWRPSESEYPIGYMSKTTLNAVRLAEKHVLGLTTPKRVTSGIQALFMTAVLCDKVTMFGMASPGTLDNHLISQLHDIDRERSFIQKVVAGENFSANTCMAKGHNTKDCTNLNRILCSMSRRARQGNFTVRMPPAAAGSVESATRLRVFRRAAPKK